MYSVTLRGKKLKKEEDEVILTPSRQVAFPE